MARRFVAIAALAALTAVGHSQTRQGSSVTPKQGVVPNAETALKVGDRVELLRLVWPAPPAPLRTMANTYGISKKDEQEIRARDKTCVYCGVLMKQSPHAMCSSGATLEHFNNDGPFSKRYNVAVCCRSCNSSKGTMKLPVWFKTLYCREKKINGETVSRPVTEYMRLEKQRNRKLRLSLVRKAR
jgi:hypothetical protein